MKKNIVDSIGDQLTYLNGGFYSNKKDTRIMVPKSFPGIGWTLNFGNPKAVRLFILMMVVIFGIIVAFSVIFGVQPH